MYQYFSPFNGNVSIPLYSYSIFSLAIHQLTDIWVVFSFLLLRITLLYTLVLYRCLCWHRNWVPKTSCPHQCPNSLCRPASGLPGAWRVFTEPLLSLPVPVACWLLGPPLPYQMCFWLLISYPQSALWRDAFCSPSNSNQLWLRQTNFFVIQWAELYLSQWGLNSSPGEGQPFQLCSSLAISLSPRVPCGFLILVPTHSFLRI